jgi:hypothetical protein
MPEILTSLPISSPIPCPLNENLGRHTSMSFFRGAGDRNTLGVSINSKVSGVIPVITLIFGSIFISDVFTLGTLEHTKTTRKSKTKLLNSKPVTSVEFVSPWW